MGHYVVGEILLGHMSSKPVSRELHGPFRRFADYTDMLIRAESPTGTKPLASATPKEWPQRGYAPHGCQKVTFFENLGIGGKVPVQVKPLSGVD